MPGKETVLSMGGMPGGKSIIKGPVSKGAEHFGELRGKGRGEEPGLAKAQKQKKMGK